MKFKYKVLTVNIILLSVAIGFTGVFMIVRNFRLSLDLAIKNAVNENNLAQSSLEYGLLEYVSSPHPILIQEIGLLGNRIEAGILTDASALTIYYNDEVIYSSGEEMNAVPYPLTSEIESGLKKYYIAEEEDVHYIYVASCNSLVAKPLLIITKRNIQDTYDLLKNDLNFFRILLFSILIVGGIVLFFLCDLITKPLVNLNKISDEMADGNYKTRAKITSRDEIGQLAAKFNYMAMSVDKHVDELEEEIKHREQFVADFTHEIKTPMTSIIGYADTMRSMELSREEEIVFLNYIYSSGKRLETMSKKLFDMLYLNQHEIEFSSIYTSALAKHVAQLVAPALTSKNITLYTEVENHIIFGDKELLSTAIVNLIDNSRKASKEGSKIYLTGHCTENSYTFAVRDEGIGISAENLDKICNEFFMVDKSRSRSEGSSGLGLSLTSLIVRRHNGEMKIESTLGKGTSISIILKEGKQS